MSQEARPAPANMSRAGHGPLVCSCLHRCIRSSPAVLHARLRRNSLASVTYHNHLSQPAATGQAAQRRVGKEHVSLEIFLRLQRPSINTPAAPQTAKPPVVPPASSNPKPRTPSSGRLGVQMEEVPESAEEREAARCELLRQV